MLLCGALRHVFLVGIVAPLSELDMALFLVAIAEFSALALFGMRPPRGRRGRKVVFRCLVYLPCRHFLSMIWRRKFASRFASVFAFDLGRGFAGELQDFSLGARSVGHAFDPRTRFGILGVVFGGFVADFARRFS